MTFFRNLIRRAGHALVNLSSTTTKANSRIAYDMSSFETHRALLQNVKELRDDDAGRAIAAETATYVYRCADLRAKAVARMPWKIVNKITGEEVDAHPWHNVMEYAYERFDQNLFYDWQYFLCIQGEQYFDKLQVPGTQVPGGLRTINPLDIEPYIEGGAILYYTYTGDVVAMQLHPDRIFMNKYRSAISDLRGSAPASRAMTATNLTRFIQNHLRAYYLNDRTPGGILSLKQGAGLQMDDAQRKQLLEEYKEQAQDPYSTIFLPAEVDYQTYRPEKPDGDQALTEDQRKDICASFNVPPVLVGAGGVSDPLSAGGTANALWAYLYENTIKPECDQKARFINDKIFPWLDPSGLHEFQWDYQEIDALQEQSGERATMYRSDFQAGAMTLNEFRAKRGYDDLPEETGEVFFIPSGYQVIPKGEIGAGVSDPLADMGMMVIPEEPAALPMPDTAQPVGEPDTPLLPAPVTTSDVLGEIRAWRRAVTKNANKMQGFVCKAIPTTLERDLKAELALLAPDDHAAIRAAFAVAEIAIQMPGHSKAAIKQAYQDAQLTPEVLAHLFEKWEKLGWFDLLDDVDKIIDQSEDDDA